MIYGQTVTWTPYYGGQRTLTVEGCPDRDTLLNHVADLLIQDETFTPPRWWQFWRWNDVISKDVIRVWREKKALLDK